MGPKVKKPPKNAFSFFLDDYVKAEREKGRQISHRIAAEECAPLWKMICKTGTVYQWIPNPWERIPGRIPKAITNKDKELTGEEKEKYTKMAACHKAHSKLDKHNKYTSTGVSFAQLEREQEELRKKLEQADTEIKMTISNLDSELLRTHFFYIIHCNYYCKTDAGIYVPGELAISEFNLEDGVRRTYHTLINPGHVPLGYAFEAKKNIEEVHGLPYPPFEEGDSDYLGILNSVSDFLEPGRLPDGRFPPLYTLEDNVKACESILQSLSENSCEGGNFFRVFLLHKMFFWLKNKCVEGLDDETVGFPVMSTAEREVSKDLFCYTSGISCAFHKTSEEKYQNCSLSIVQRSAYTICDHCCQYVDVEMVPGKHCGLKTDVSRKPAASRAPSERSFRERRSPPPLSEASEFEGQSSFGGDFGFDWRREPGCSFLHDELESKFSALETSSVGSRFSRALSTPGFSAAPSVRSRTVRGEEEEEEEDEDFNAMLSLGRGAKRL